MSDESVRTALRSDLPLVLVEAPAGCGKTHHGADYARELARADSVSRPLILTHTHAACSVFAERTRESRNRVEIRTIDSVVAHIAAAYHVGLRIPADTASWVRQREQGYAELALKVAKLLQRHPMIASAMARRHPVVICDEHQDSSGDQHAVVMALHAQGARLRVFADPMQKVFSEKTLDGSCPPCDWDDLKGKAHACEELDVPHRWADGCPALGEWTLQARKTLRAGGTLDLHGGLPESVYVVIAENLAQKNREYALSKQDRKPVDAFEHDQPSLLILTRHNQTGRSFRGFFNRRIPLWEGHTRSGLDRLVDALIAGRGDPAALAGAAVKFMDDVGKGFSPSAFGNAFQQEVAEGCNKSRKGKPARIQELARCLLAEPDHRGVARMLRRVSELKTADPAFAEIEMDCHKEFWDAIGLGNFESVDVGPPGKKTAAARRLA